MSNHHYHQHCQAENHEIGAVEGLLKLQQPTKHFATLSPIYSSQQDSHQRLPSLSNLLLPNSHQHQQQQQQQQRQQQNLQHQHQHQHQQPHHQYHQHKHPQQHQESNRLYVHGNHSWASGSTANLLYSPSDDTSSIYSCTGTHRPPLIPPLSTSTSFSSLRSCNSSIKSNQKASLLSRAATFTGRRRGRPRKQTGPPEIKNEIKIVDMSYYNYQTEEGMQNLPTNKPRWQEAERLELLEAIVKEKELDDMTTIRWDRISLAVGRAKKACKDQWRRELLPNLMKGLKPNKKEK